MSGKANANADADAKDASAEAHADDASADAAIPASQPMRAELCRSCAPAHAPTQRLDCARPAGTKAAMDSSQRALPPACACR